MGNISEIDEGYMRRCLELAKLGNCYVAPNPMVGAVLVHDSRIIGEGWHRKFGEAHAEVNCLASVKPVDRPLIERSTLYVSLEPCAHHGKTPPCADAIIENRIPRVVISVLDPHILAKANGQQKLQAAGIDVVTGVLENEGRQLIKHFLCFHERKRPFITLKWAESADGFIGREKERVHISNALSDRLVHQLRAEHEGILIGKNTLLNDDPKLTVRLVPGKDPVRIILARDGKIPENSNIFRHSSGYTLVVNETKACYAEHLECIKVSDTRDIHGVLQALHELKIISVLVEGGAQVLNSFLQSGYWDEAVLIRSDKLLSQGIPAPTARGELLREIQLDNDRIQHIKNRNDLSFT